MDCLFFPVTLDASTSFSSSFHIFRLTEHENSLLLQSRPNVNNTQFVVLAIIRLISRRSFAIPQNSLFWWSRMLSPNRSSTTGSCCGGWKSKEPSWKIELIKTLLFLNWFWLCVRVSLFLLKITQRLNRGMTLISGTEIWHWGTKKTWTLEDLQLTFHAPTPKILFGDDTLTTSGRLLNTWNYYHLLQFPLNYNRTGHLYSMGSDPDSRRV